MKMFGGIEGDEVCQDCATFNFARVTVQIKGAGLLYGPSSFIKFVPLERATEEGISCNAA